MIRVIFDGKLSSKGHPPAKWNLAKWLYRAFVWETVKPVFVQKDFEEGELKFAERWGIFDISAMDYNETVSVTLYVSGIEVADWEADISDFAFEQRIKWSVAGQKLDGLLTITLE